MRTKSILTFLVAVLVPAMSCRADVTFDELFHIRLAEAERSLGAERLKMLRGALEDFNAVLNFKAPIHAALDKDAALPADGGSSFYKARGYRITIMKSLFSLGDDGQPIVGYMYGPELTLGPGSRGWKRGQYVASLVLSDRHAEQAPQMITDATAPEPTRPLSHAGSPPNDYYRCAARC